MAPAALSQIQSLLSAGRLVEARDALQAAMRRGSNAQLDHAMAITLLRLGQHDQAEFFAQRAADSLPAPETLTTLGNILTLRGKSAKAVPAFDRALRLKPDHLNARLGLANAHRLDHRLTQALEALAPARHLTPPDAAPAVEATYAATLLWMGRVEEAWTILRDAGDRFPDDELLATSLANAACYHPALSAREEHDAQLRYGALFTRTIRVTRPSPLPTHSRDPDRPLRVGFLSPDLRRHSVAFFLLPLWRNLDPAQVEIVGYASCVPDEVTAQFQKLVASPANFRPVAHLSDHDLAVQIHRDAIDILIDLAGHTQGRRLPVFYLKPAPVQVAYLGYPSITGLPRDLVAARLVDPFTDPPDSHESPDGERLLRLEPGPFLAYEPPVDPAKAPVPTRPPLAGRPVTFASFNAVPKINDAVLTLWSRILTAVPSSRLLLKAVQFGDAPTRQRYTDRLAALGVSPDRVEVLPPTPGSAAGLLAHLNTYARADLALDTFPYGGTTTTCEAAFMGVPTVTLAGDRHASRVGATINQALLGGGGLSDLTASTPDQYVSTAVALAADPARLTTLHQTLRDRLLTGPLGDGARLARAVEGALRGLWRDWCVSAPSA